MKRKIGICVDLNESSVNKLKEKLAGINLADVEKVYLIHGFQRQVYVDNFFFTQFPFKEQMEEVEKSVIQVLTDIEKSLTNGNDSLEVEKKCLFSDYPKKEIADYVDEQEMDQLIIATRTKSGIEGLFSSSFAEYMLRHVKSELLVIRC